MAKDFFSRIEEICKKKESLLCTGLDPRIELKEGESAKDKLFGFCKRIIDATMKYTVCYKPNSAFFEAYGAEGITALKQVIKYINNEVPIILDAKRGDIGATAEAYAQSFEKLNADAITLSPYMGQDTIAPFLKNPTKGAFILCRTTNPGAPALQDIPINFMDGSSLPLYARTAQIVTSWNKRIGLVVAGNDREALAKVRRIAPNTWFLSPGIGTQGGTMEEAVILGARKDGLGILINVSRAIAEADNPEQTAKEYAEASGKAFKTAQAKNSSLAENKLDNQLTVLKEKLLTGLIKTECFKTGEFTLKSGLKSPFYIDLRRIQSDPRLLKIAAKAYQTLATGLAYDRLAGIPIAALPLSTALSLYADIPLIYPRMSAKGHGTGNQIEGNWNKGETILLLDDLITTGKSKVEAIEILRNNGLIVNDLIVLIERGVQGRQDMEAAGINLHSFIGVEDLLDTCIKLGKITAEEHKSMLDYARQ